MRRAPVATVALAMKRPHLAIVGLLAACIVLIGIGPKWLGDRPSHASTIRPPAEETEPRAPVDVTLLEAERTAVPVPKGDEAEPVVEEAVPESPDDGRIASYTFLPTDLQPLSAMIPEALEAFDAATPAEQLILGRELLAHSIAVIQCASGRGPVPPGSPDDGNLALTGQDGRWAFQVNASIFQFHDFEFPEYPEYIAVLRTAYDDEMRPVETPVELPPELALKIRRRAQEALAWL